MPPQPARAALSAAERNVLSHYVDALVHEHYADAYALLAPSERGYFRSVENFASGFRADRVKISRFKIIGSTSVPNAGVIGIVLEHVSYFDHGHQTMQTIDANVRYGVVRVAGGLAIRDLFHPWFAFDPVGATVETNGVRATVRKISFFTGRVELLVTFANYGSDTVTLLPYGRTVLRDGAGSAHVPLATKIGSLTDRTLYEGLRLAPRAEYTGALTFVTVDRYAPHRLSLTIAPAVADGGDAPFELVLPPVDVPVLK